MDYGEKLLDADPREVKLPVWAQDTMNSLRREYRRERDRADAARLATDPAESRAVIDAHDDRAQIGLGNQTIRFKLGARPSDPSPYVECYVDKGRVYVRGSDSIALRPWSGNVVHVWVER